MGDIKITQHGTGFPIKFIRGDVQLIECPECGGRACHSKYRGNDTGIKITSICLTCGDWFEIYETYEELKNDST